MNNVISISSYRKTKPLPLPHPGPPPLPPAPWHMQIARWCLVWHRALPHVAGLQEHEVRFLIQMLEREQSTERQDAWLAKLGDDHGLGRRSGTQQAEFSFGPIMGGEVELARIQRRRRAREAGE